MKVKTTRKNLLNNYGTACALSIGYCDAWHLLKGAGLEPFAYCAGVYGWNFDAYDVDGVLICTGYRGMIGKQAETVRKYEEKARALVEGLKFNPDTYKKDREKMRKKCQKLLADFVKSNFEKGGNNDR